MNVHIRHSKCYACCEFCTQSMLCNLIIIILVKDPKKYNYSGVSVITAQTFQDKSMVPEEFFTKRTLWNLYAKISKLFPIVCTLIRFNIKHTIHLSSRGIPYTSKLCN